MSTQTEGALGRCGPSVTWLVSEGQERTRTRREKCRVSVEAEIGVSQLEVKEHQALAGDPGAKGACGERVALPEAAPWSSVREGPPVVLSHPDVAICHL